MYHQSLYLDAIDVVLAWDIPDEAIADAAVAQASLMAGECPD